LLGLLWKRGAYHFDILLLFRIFCRTDISHMNRESIASVYKIIAELTFSINSALTLSMQALYAIF